MGLGSIAIAAGGGLIEHPEYLQRPPEEIALNVAYVGAFYTGGVSLCFASIGYLDRKVFSP